jgi:hypothetical protein
MSCQLLLFDVDDAESLANSIKQSTQRRGEKEGTYRERTQVGARRAKPKRVSLWGKGTKSEIIAFNPRIVLTTIKIL